MAKYRWKGDYEADITAIGRLVSPEEGQDVVEIDDELVAMEIVHKPTGLVIGHDQDAGGFVWPPELWSEMTAPKGRSRFTTDDDIALAVSEGVLVIPRLPIAAAAEDKKPAAAKPVSGAKPAKSDDEKGAKE